MSADGLPVGNTLDDWVDNLVIGADVIETDGREYGLAD